MSIVLIPVFVPLLPISNLRIGVHPNKIGVGKMTGYFPDQGLIFIIQQLVANNLKLHLFTNNITPSDSTVLAGLTEAAWTGYASQTLSSGTWVSLGVASHIGAMAYPVCTFLNTSGGSVSAYGWYITDNAVTMLVAVGLFDSAPVTLPATTGSYSFIPTIGDLSQY